MTLTKDGLIAQISASVGFPVTQSNELLENVIELLKAAIEEQGEVKISSFGKWTTKTKRARPGRNPHTGQKIQIEARRVLTFHPADKLRNKINAALESPDSPGSKNS